MDIEDIYSLIPDFPCIPGCTECCRNFGVPSRTKAEDERLREYLRQHGMQPGEAKETQCPYVSDKGCTVYPVRPFTCRLYGTSVNYRCKLGAQPIHILDEDEEAEIFHLYRSNFF